MYYARADGGSKPMDEPDQQAQIETCGAYGPQTYIANIMLLLLYNKKLAPTFQHCSQQTVT